MTEIVESLVAAPPTHHILDLRDVAARLNAPTSILPLVVLRVVFGILMFASTLRFILNGWVTAFYVIPTFHFTYLGFSWVHPLPEVGMYFVFGFMLLLSISIVLGIHYRLSMAAFFVCFTYVELLDKAYYLNHYYFISLLSFLLIFLPLNRAVSVDGWRKPTLRTASVPRWTVLAIRYQVGIVYFFAGFAKINPDWLLHALPLRIWLPPHADFPLIGSLFLTPWFPYLMSWAGAFYDLTIAFWLSWRRTRFVAYIAVVGFHVMTALLFPIGMFPWIMIAIAIIFFDERDYVTIIKLADRLVRVQVVSNPAPPNQISSPFPHPNRILIILMVIFFAVQLLTPLRYLLYPGDTNWTQQGFRFSWRVMLVESAGYVTFFVHDPVSGKHWEVYPDQYLNTTQEHQMAFQPDMIHEFAL